MPVEFGYAILYVPSVPAALRFYEAAFGFEGSFLHEAGDYGELRTGATRLAFVSHAQAAQAVPFPYQPVDQASPRFGVSFTFTTRDVDAAWKRALAAGATSLAEPHDTSWGQRVAHVADCHGFALELATPIG